MKLISFIVPCFNSAEYMEKCVDSLLFFPEQTEVIIIDDGSTDNTPAIADAYARRYPDAVKVIHQENAGHGGAVNAGISVAEGLYTKIVDSDDWLNTTALESILERLKTVEEEGGVDLLITDYRYYRKNKGFEKTVCYKSFFPVDKIVTWNDISLWKMRPWQQFLIHALMFRTETIRNSGMVLPEKVYYEDNYILYYFFPFCRKILYLNTVIYVYLVGREGQSVSREMLLKHNNDVKQVTEACWNLYELDTIRKKDKKLYHILRRELWLLLASAILFSRIPRSKEADDAVGRFCKKLKSTNKKYYDRFMLRNFLIFLRIPGPVGRFLALDIVMNLAHAFVGFN